MKTLVLGLGNLLLGDEGVGVHAARALMAEGCPEETMILDVGTAILDALPAIEKAERVIVIDAVKAGGEPGSIYCTPMDAYVQPNCIASMHGFDIGRVLALAGRHKPPEVLVVGVEPARMAWSLELSPEVAKALPAAVDLVQRAISRHNPNRLESLPETSTASSIAR